MMKKSDIKNLFYKTLTGLVLISLSAYAYAHGIHGPDRAFIENSVGLAPAAFMYLGAKHMITGYDHLLYLIGVIFYLSNFRDVIKLVSLFALGHSITLLFGVLANVHVNPYFIDALIGFSVVYKAYENLGGFKRLNISPSIPGAVFIFGLIHGFGLATKIQEFSLSQEGIVTNIISFNVGVEIGQICALAIILIFFKLFQRSHYFNKTSLYINWLLMVAGFVLVGYQLTGLFLQT